MTEPARIFIVEDEAIIAADIAAMLQAIGYAVAGSAGTAAEALDKIFESRPDLVLMDIMISGGLDGIGLAQQLKARDIPVVFLTAYADTATLRRAKITEPYGYVLKPFTDRELQIAVDIALYRHRTDRALREHSRQLERVRAAFDQLAEALMMARADGTVLYVNKAFERLTGFAAAEVVGGSVLYDPRLQADPETHRAIWNTITRGTSWSGQFTTVAKDGTTVDIEASITPVRGEDGAIESFIGISRDVSHERALERQLRHAQKLEAIGTLAGGIAHDFNNILAAIIGYTELAAQQVERESRLGDHLAHVLGAAERAKNLVQQILTFSRRGEQALRPVALQPLVKETLRLLRAAVPALIEIRTELHAERDVMLADPTQMHQMIMNLCVNAADAIGEQPGTLTVSIHNEQLDDDAGRVIGTASGDYAVLTVADTGCGMPQDVIERIFDPFFTTKQEGKGTGLGLSVVHGIVRSHNGAITVASVPGKGSRFCVYLPLAREERETPAAAPVDQDLPRGFGRVLVVDDEQAITDITQEILSRLGYTVIAATDPREALVLVREHPADFDLVISDYTMPHMTGETLIREINAIRPGLPVILCTGHSDKINREQARAFGARDLLLKPVNRRLLAQTVHEVLAAP